VPQVASEAHAASHAGARSSQRNRPADSRSDAPPTPFAALIDRAAGDGDLAARAGQPAEAVTSTETSRNADRPRHDRHDGGRRNDRVESSGNDKPARQRHGAGKARGNADPADAKGATQPATQGAGTDASQDAKITGDSDAATDGDDTTVTDDGKGSTDAADAALLADALPVTTTDAAPADAVKAVIAAAVATPTAPVAADAGDTPTTGADPVIGGGQPSTPALLAADLKVAAGDDTRADGKAEGKSDAAKSADATDGPDDATLRDAFKAQHTGDARDGKPADAAQAKPADGDAKAASDQTAHHAAAADKAADAPAPAHASSQTAQNQLPQTQLPQAQHAAQPSAAPASAAAAQQAPAVPIEGVAVQITAQAKAGKQSFGIRLDPPELGRIDVRLDVDRHGHVTSRLVVDRPETLDLLRRDAGGLERALQDAGLKTSDNGLQFSLRDQTMQQQAFRQSRDTAEVIVRDDALPPVETMQRGYRSLSGARGGVDISV
jgi:chemotaxis protein MotD